MPRSSVYVRLNWPSKSEDSAGESSASTPSGESCQDVVLSNGNKGAMPNAKTQSEENSPGKVQDVVPVTQLSPVPLKEVTSTKKVTGTRSKGKHSTKEKAEKATETIGLTTPKIHSSLMSPSGARCLDTSHSLDVPLWSGPKQQPFFEQNSVPGSTLSSSDKLNEKHRKEEHESGKQNPKPKTKPKPRNLSNKGRKITRSLSASCVSVSTNTDPKDFLELAKVSAACATLPVRKRDKDPCELLTSKSSGTETEHATGSSRYNILHNGKPLATLHNDCSASDIVQGSSSISDSLHKNNNASNTVHKNNNTFDTFHSNGDSADNVHNNGSTYDTKHNNNNASDNVYNSNCAPNTMNSNATTSEPQHTNNSTSDIMNCNSSACTAEESNGKACFQDEVVVPVELLIDFEDPVRPVHQLVHTSEIEEREEESRPRKKNQNVLVSKMSSESETGKIEQNINDECNDLTVDYIELPTYIPNVCQEPSPVTTGEEHTDDQSDLACVRIASPGISQLQDFGKENCERIQALNVHRNPTACINQSHFGISLDSELCNRLNVSEEFSSTPTPSLLVDEQNAVNQTRVIPSEHQTSIKTASIESERTDCLPNYIRHDSDIDCDQTEIPVEKEESTNHHYQQPSASLETLDLVHVQDGEKKAGSQHAYETKCEKKDVESLIGSPVMERNLTYQMQWLMGSRNEYTTEATFRRQQMDKDKSLESCPDVVLQTLEAEGISPPNKSLKKTVTFLLPPEHWDSLISLKENNVGGYPPSGYAELDGALDRYRNTPSPGIHSISQDRYDGGLEGDVHVGDYPEDGRFSGVEGGPVYPPDGVVYGHLMGAPRSPYTMNGGLAASAEPLLPSPALYDEEPPPHVQPSAPPPSHISPPTPSLPPPPIQNHDNYAHPNLLRSPSADSGAPRVRWRDPDLHEVIDFLSNPNNVVKANAAAYLQHLCYMDDPTKQKTRILGGIPPLVALLSHDLPELHRNACGALRNLSYGRQNDENKRAIKDASGIPALVRLLRKTPDNEIKELVTGILWNLSSCEDLKHSIIDDALTVTVSHVIIPCSGWDGGEVERDPNVDVWWSTVFKNASGVLRNVSSAGEYARTKLRQCLGLVDSLLTVIKSAIQGSSHDNKSVENCVCILRNLSYRCQEVEDPNYDKNQPPTQSRATATTKGDNLGCFGGSRKKKEAVGGGMKETSTGQRSTGPRTEPLRGMELLWQPEVVVGPYLALLSDCSNPETLEAAAGALQNLAACYWQPSIDVRAAVRKEKGLPILVELLRMEVDRVVCAVATALRNLAIDQRNKELIGKYAMRDLVQKLPSGNTHDSGTSDETIAAVLATLNEVIKKSAEFSRSLLDVGGVERLVNMTRHRGRYSVRVVKFASQVLFSMWGHQELREVYKKAGWKEQDFVSKSVAARNAAGGGANSPTANNTLNRPMASQGGTRYEDRTIQRGQGKSRQYNRGEEVAMADMGYGGNGGGSGVVPPAGGVRLYPPVQGKPGEPVYAKVNRDKKRNRQYDGPHYGTLGAVADDWGSPVYSASPTATPNFNNTSSMNNNNANTANNNNGVLMDNADAQAGDSWV